jgi:putative copper export protein
MWDIKISLFIHVFSIATWFGSTTLMAMYLRNETRSNEQLAMTNALGTAHRWNLTMMIPTSVLVLITGMYMLIQYEGDKPFWLLMKERLGSLFIIAFILLITLYGKKLLQAAKNASSADAAVAPVKRYIMVLNISVLIMALLIFFVTTKIS